MNSVENPEKDISNVESETEETNSTILSGRFGRFKKVIKVFFGKITLKLIKRMSIAVFLPLICVLIILLGADAILCLGPSESVTGFFVTTVTETSAAKFLARIFLSKQEVEEILADNSAMEFNEVTDPSLIEIKDEKNDSIEPIEIIDIHGDTFEGKLMIVADPSRVVLATLPYYSDSAMGKTVKKFISENDAIAGINAGGFDDYIGTGDGGLPVGLVIAEGKLRFGNKNEKYTVIGFDKNDRLVVGKMTGKDALDRGVRDAVSFGPALIVNGERAQIKGSGGGFNPRTCIGQRADGAVLLLVLDGRRPDSIGATYEDCIDLMEKYGAVNAGNLDGGMSSVIYYKGKMLNQSASIYGQRTMPTAFVVKKEE